MIISVQAQRILKVLHLLAVAAWIGGYLSEVLLFYASTTAQTGDELFGMLRSSRYVAMYVVVYLGAFGSFFTGLAYSLCTNRGFFRHRWVIIKWASTVALIFFGTWYLGPWSVEMLELAQDLGLAALAAPDFLALRSGHLSFLIVNLAVFILLIAVSVFKPWETAEAVRLLNRKLRVEK